MRERRGPGSGQPQTEFYEGPAEAAADVVGLSGPDRQAVGLGLGVEVGGAGVVQGEVGLGVLHRASASQSVLMGKVRVCTRMVLASGASATSGRSR
ncbi:hypothetical protein GCM10022295_77340 [Streptomyces osmaniensis]|uniref:Uncharacterized protein n=1 Tax=Streptomyces osmaniensis TaxID=593134 RepID=A0ABP6YLB9_9ACTN